MMPFARSSLAPSLFAALLVTAAALAGIVPLILFAVQSGGEIGLDAYVLRILGFTLLQATLSTAISVALAIPAARAISRHHFPGRSLLLALLAVPQALPAIVVVLMLVALFGASGLLAGTLPLYGLMGIVAAHVYFNLPLALRLFLEALDGVTPESRRLAAQLGFTPWRNWVLVEWPALRPVVPRAAALIFLLCAASFVVVLTLGGPAATTLEVAIYQSLRLDFDVARALSLSLLQVALCAVLIFLTGRTAWTEATAVRRHAGISPWTQPKAAETAVNAALVLTVAAIAGLPLIVLALQGAQHISLTPLMAQAFLTSAGIALVSTALTLALAWPMARAQATYGGVFAVVTLMGLIVPPAVLATGWFVGLRGFSASTALAVGLIALLNALMSLPFATGLLAPAFAALSERHDRLAAQLGLTGFNRFRFADYPPLIRPLAQAGLFAFVLSLGDLTAVTLLGSQGLVTLPSLLHLQMGNYRSGEALGTGLVLALLCLALGLSANARRRGP